MKRIFLPILLFIGIMRAAANPIAPPWIHISELQFTEDKSWVLELVIEHSSYSTVGILEEIWIKSNSGESKLEHFEDDAYYKLFVVEKR
jgi:hypothetical protein